MVSVAPPVCLLATFLALAAASPLAPAPTPAAGFSETFKFKATAPVDIVSLEGSADVNVDASGASFKGATTFVMGPDMGKVPVGVTLLPNQYTVDATITMGTAPCNVLDLTFTAQASIEMNMGLDTSSCLLGNINQCIYDGVKAKYQDKHASWVTKWGSSTLGGKYVQELKVPIPAFTKTINFANDVTNVKIRLSSLLDDIPESAPLGEFMALTGTDVVWYITPDSFSTMFTGVQFAVTMEIEALDLAQSTAPGMKELVSKLSEVGLDALAKPLIDDKLDFFKLVEKYVPDADKPSWVNKDGVMTIGDVSPACQKDPKSFGLTIAGISEQDLSPASIQDALGKVALNAVAADKKKLMPDCKTPSYAMPLGGDTIGSKTKKLASAAICLFDNIKVPSTLTSGAPVKITGSSNAGASMNPGGLNAILKDAITKNGLTIGGKTADKPTFTGDGCTDADRKAAGKFAPSACGAGASPSPTPPSPTPPSPTPGGGGGDPGSKGLSGGSIGAIVAGGVAVLIIAGVGGAAYTGKMKNPFKSSDTEPLIDPSATHAVEDGAITEES